MPEKGGPPLLLCGCPIFCQIFTVSFLGHEMELFLGKIQILKNDNFFLGGITLKKP